MPFFDANQQQQLMQQMFTGANGAPMPPMGQGQGGVGQGGTQLGPSFEMPGDPGQMGQMIGGSAPQDLGVQAPDQFNLPVPQIGDEAMVRKPPNSFGDNMPTEIPEGYAGQWGPNNIAQGAQDLAGSMNLGEDAKRRLIDAIMARGVI